MSTIADFNRIEDCNKIDAQCVNAFVDAKLSEDEPTVLEISTSWGSPEVDLAPIVKISETLTTMYLSPDENPNCLVYEPERGDNICIHGDDLSRIISMTKLKDVDQETPITDGYVYMYDDDDNLFKPFDLQTFVDNTNTAIADLQSRMTTLEQTIANHETRIQVIEALLVPPANAPNDARLAWGTINLYSDPNAAINSSGATTSLDKTHGLYTHDLNTTAYADEIMG